MHVRAEGVMCMLIPALTLFFMASPGIKRHELAQVSVPAKQARGRVRRCDEQASGRCGRIKSKCGPCSLRSNFSLSPSPCFCRQYVTTATTALETRRESAHVIRIVGRQIELRFDLPIR